MIVEFHMHELEIQLFFSMKGGVGLFEHLNDEDLIESYERSIKENLDKDFINLLKIAIKQRGLENLVKAKIDKKNPKQMMKT